jgi:hypothetical protein
MPYWKFGASGIADGSIMRPHIDARKHIAWEQWCEHHLPRSPYHLILPEQGEEGFNTQLPEVELSLLFLARFRSDYIPSTVVTVKSHPF